MGNRDGAEALRQARSVLTELNAEWPDVQITQRTVRAEAPTALADALASESIGIAIHALDTLPLELPEGVTLAAVARRQEPRTALVARQAKELSALTADDLVGVRPGRDAEFLAALRPDLKTTPLTTRLDDDLGRLTRNELQAMLVPGVTLLMLDQRNRMDALLEPEAFAPAPGQGAIGLLVRDVDDLAFELAYTLQHRPSYDRVRAERAFAAALPGKRVGALASVTSDGDLTLFGSVANGGTSLQASVTGDASEAESLGQELASDVLEQLTALDG